MNIKYIFPVLAGLLLSGCGTLPPLEPGAQDVALRIGKAPAHCKLIAGIMGAENPAASGRLLSQQALDTEIIRDLKNNTVRLGGNMVLVFGYGSERLNVGEDYDEQFYVNGVRYPALVYKCPPEDLLDVTADFYTTANK